jgi:rabankyrin-5
LAIHVDVNSRVHLAVASENKMLVRNLILVGTRVNDRDARTQKTTLHIAAESGREENVSALLQNNCDFDAVDNEGDNAEKQ